PGGRDTRVCRAAAGAAVFRRRDRPAAPAMMRRRTLADREDVLGVALLAPALGYVILLVGVPFVLAIALSFSNATAGSLRFGWAGLRNYAAILADPVFLVAGLSSIPQEIVEAAIVDGAGFWRRLFQIELPLLLPVVTVAVLFGVVYTATDLGVVYILTGGGPANTTHVLPTLAFQRGI